MRSGGEKSVRTRFYIELETEGDAAALKDQLSNLLLAANLAPGFEQAELDRRRDDLLKEVMEPRREALRKAFVMTLFEPMYASWGMISNVSGRVYEVRMSNPYAFRLQASVARVVSALRARCGEVQDRSEIQARGRNFRTGRGPLARAGAHPGSAPVARRPGRQAGAMAIVPARGTGCRGRVAHDNAGSVWFCFARPVRRFGALAAVVDGDDWSPRGGWHGRGGDDPCGCVLALAPFAERGAGRLAAGGPKVSVCDQAVT